MPPTIAIWFMAIMRPRMCAGVISAMYIGVEMEAIPIPMPPMTRKTIKVQTVKRNESKFL